MFKVKGEGKEEVFTPIEEFTGTSTKTLGISLCAQPNTRNKKQLPFLEGDQIH